MIKLILPQLVSTCLDRWAVMEDVSGRCERGAFKQVVDEKDCTDLSPISKVADVGKLAITIVDKNEVIKWVLRSVYS